MGRKIRIIPAKYGWIFGASVAIGWRGSYGFLPRIFSVAPGPSRAYVRAVLSERGAAHTSRGSWSLLTKANEARVKILLETCSNKHQIQVYRFVNVGNHLHLLIKTKRRDYETAKTDLHRFLKQFAGEVAFQVTGARKTSAKGRFWAKRAYSRIVTWGREYQGLKDYFTKNLFESKGLWTPGDSWLRPILVSLQEAGMAAPS